MASHESAVWMLHKKAKPAMRYRVNLLTRPVESNVQICKSTDSDTPSLVRQSTKENDMAPLK